MKRSTAGLAGILILAGVVTTTPATAEEAKSATTAARILVHGTTPVMDDDDRLELQLHLIPDANLVSGGPFVAYLGLGGIPIGGGLTMEVDLGFILERGDEGRREWLVSLRPSGKWLDLIEFGSILDIRPSTSGYLWGGLGFRVHDRILLFTDVEGTRDARDDEAERSAEVEYSLRYGPAVGVKLNRWLELDAIVYYHDVGIVDGASFWDRAGGFVRFHIKLDEPDRTDGADTDQSR